MFYMLYDMLIKRRFLVNILGYKNLSIFLVLQDELYFYTNLQ
jgi:hypothetical protein